MKAIKNVQQMLCAEGSQNIGPARTATTPDPAQIGRQRDLVIIQSPAPAVRN